MLIHCTKFSKSNHQLSRIPFNYHQSISFGDIKLVLLNYISPLFNFSIGIVFKSFSYNALTSYKTFEANYPLSQSPFELLLILYSSAQIQTCPSKL